MYRIEVNNIINKIIVVFPIFGLWDDGHHITKRKLFSLILIASFVLSLAIGALESDAKEDYVYLAATAFTYGIQLAKLVHIIWKRNEIFEFIHKSGIHVIDDYEEFIQVNNKINKFTKPVTYFLFALITTTALVLFCFGVSIEKNVPIEIAFPLDYKNSEIGYWLVYLYFAAVLLYAIVILLLNIIIWYVMLSFSIKYQLLSNDLRRLGVNKVIQTKSRLQRIREVEKDNSYLKDLIASTKKHQHLQETIEQFRSCFSNLFFIQIGTSGACICGAAHSLAFDSHTDLLKPSIYIVLLLYCTFDIFMLTYLGNEIECSSDQLSYCLFESNWIDQPNSCKKYVIILGEFLRQPQQLVICKLYPLNLVTFILIVKLAYNMFNILKNLN